MLIRKTTVLTGKNAQGHVTLIRVGSSVGLKLIIDPAPDEKLILSLAVGGNPQVNVPVKGARTETNVNIDLEALDNIGAVVYTDSGEVYLAGGKRDRVSPPDTLKVSAETPLTVSAASDFAANARENIPGISSDEVLSDSADVASGMDDCGENTYLWDTVIQNNGSVTEENFKNKESGADGGSTDTVTEVGDESELRQEVFSPFKFNRGENFYRNIRYRLEEIMTINPECMELEKIIPDSKWVKVYYDEDEYYVVGILTEDGEVTYLGYGVPGVEGIRPPKEAEELCDFLPVSGGEEEGYWLMFQNSKNGELVKSLK